MLLRSRCVSVDGHIRFAIKNMDTHCRPVAENHAVEIYPTYKGQGRFEIDSERETIEMFYFKPWACVNTKNLKCSNGEITLKILFIFTLMGGN